MIESISKLRRFQLEQIRDGFGLLCDGKVYLRGDELPAQIDWSRIDYRRLNRAERRYAMGRRGKI
jgi:hypothetical protein